MSAASFEGSPSDSPVSIENEINSLPIISGTVHSKLVTEVPRDGKEGNASKPMTPVLLPNACTVPGGACIRPSFTIGTEMVTTSPGTASYGEGMVSIVPDLLRSTEIETDSSLRSTSCISGSSVTVETPMLSVPTLAKIPCEPYSPTTYESSPYAP